MLRARLIVEPRRAGHPEEFRAVGALANESNVPTEIRPALVESPSLALEITDAAGEPLLIPPPPVPGGALESVRLAPGEEYRAHLVAFLPAWSEPGTYRARVRYRADGEPVLSEWVEFELLDGS